jgi:quercetin dioxygenase-like cupin family protein
MSRRYLTDPDHADVAEEVEQMLAEQLPAMTPAPARAADLRLRMLQRVRAASTAELDLSGVRLTEGEWRPLVRGVLAKTLSPGGEAVLLDIAAGAQLPLHRHDIDEECVVLRGEVQMPDIHVRAGDYHMARSGSRHGTIRAPDGALIYLRGAPIGDTGRALTSIVTALVPGRRIDLVTLRADLGEWHDVAPGVAKRVLHEFADHESCMLRFAPGASLRAGFLPSDQESLIVAGEVYYGRRIATLGDYWIGSAGRPAPELASDEGAVVFVRGTRVG